MPDSHGTDQRYKLLSRTLTKMIRRNPALFQGTTMRGKFSGRPENVYGGWRVNATQFEHELMLTDYVKALVTVFPGVEITRGYDLEAWADAEVRGTRDRLIELDRATESREQWDKRVKALKTTGKGVQILAPTEARLQKLKRWSAEIEDIAFFAIWEQAVRNPAGPVWSTVGSEEKLAMKP